MPATKLKLLLALPALALLIPVAKAQVAIGEWRDHFSYQQARSVVAGGADVFCATSTALFRYNQGSGETERYTKVNRLNDVNILGLGWSPVHSTLLVGYKNGNLDLIRGSSTFNMPDIKRSNVVGDKGIYAIHTAGDLAYLGCGFGIVVVDLVRREVKDTWLIGPEASPLRVNGIAILNDSILAATDQGLYTAWLGVGNLAAYTNWHRRNDLPGADGPVEYVLVFNQQLVVSKSGGSEPDAVLYHDADWHALVTAGQVVDLQTDPAGQRLLVSTSNWVREYGTDFSELEYIDHYGSQALRPSAALRTDDQGIWIATQDNGLVRFRGFGDHDVIMPNGPKTNTNYRMAWGKGALYVTTGSPSGNWMNSFLKDGVHYLVDGRWHTTDRFNDPMFAAGGNDYAGALNDPMAIVVDPNDGDHVFMGSWDDGVLEMRNGKGVQFFGADNSTLQRHENSPSNDQPTRVGGLAWDDRGNLWVTNSYCANPISVRLRNGNWYNGSTGSVLGNNTLLSDIVVARNGYKWIVRPRGAGLLVYTDNNTPTQPEDDRAKVLSKFEGEGNLPSTDVLSVAEDLDGQIWVGTNRGIAVFYNPDLVFTDENFDAQQILIEQDGNVQLLLETESVTSIVVDGANRKWLGTQSSGVYQVSADGTDQLAHFTAENSPLPSNDVICMAMDEESGELFIGTDLGIVSFRSDATGGLAKAECATVFPNPVRETYTGQVAITGLARNSDLRITDVAGNLVYHTRSLGGQATWPITDMNGNRVSTGVYLILAMDPQGESHCNTKVAVIR